MKKLETRRLAKMSGQLGGADEFRSQDGGIGAVLRAVMRLDGSLDIVTDSKDGSGRPRSTQIHISLDAARRLHHSIAESLKARGLHLDLETRAELQARTAAEAEKLSRGMSRVAA